MVVTEPSTAHGERGELGPLAATFGIGLLLALGAFAVGVNASGARAGAVASLAILLATAVFGRCAYAGRLPGTINASLGLLFMALLAAITALSVDWSLTPNESMLDAIRLIAYTCVLALAALLAQLHPERARELLLGIGLAALIIAIYALASRALPGLFDQSDNFARVRLPFGYWNAVGTVCALGLVAWLWAGTRRRERAWIEIASFPAGGLLLAAMMLSQSRGVLLALAAGLALWFLLVPMRLRSVGWLAVVATLCAPVVLWAYSRPALTTDGLALAERQSIGWKLLLALTLMSALLALAGFAIRRVRHRSPLSAPRRRGIGKALLIALAISPFALAISVGVGSERGVSTFGDKASDFFTTSALAPQNAPSRLTQTNSLRGRYWSEARTIWRHHKWTGTGADTFGTARLQYRTDLLNASHAHGMVPQVAADLGLFGLLALLGLTIVWVTAAVKLAGARRAPPWRWLSVDDELRQASVAIMLLAVVFGVHSAIDWVWFLPGVAFFGLLAGGWTLGTPDAHSAHNRGEVAENPTRGGLANSLVAAAIALVGLTIAWSVYQPVRATQKIEASYEVAGSDPAKAERLARDAIKLDPTSADAPMLLATAEVNAGHPNRAERTLLALAADQPSNPAVWRRLAEFRLTSLEDPEGAIKALGPLSYISPLDVQGAALLKAAQAVMVQQEVEELAARNRRKLERQLKAVEKLRREGVIPAG